MYTRTYSLLEEAAAMFTKKFIPKFIPRSLQKKSASQNGKVLSKPSQVNDTPEWQKDVIKEIYSFGTDYDELLERSYRKYLDEYYEPILTTGDELQDRAEHIRINLSKLRVVCPDLVRKALRLHPLHDRDNWLNDERIDHE